MKVAGNFFSNTFFARNIVWSLLGAGLPLLIGVYAIPRLIDGLGAEKFGLLAIIWVGIGYFSLFDFGIGRALTKLVAEQVGVGNDERLGDLIKTSLQLLVLLGVIAALVVIGLTQVLIDSVFHVTESLRGEATWSLWILAVTLPFVVTTAGLVGLLQAYQRFRVISTIRIPLGLSNFLGPVLLLPYTDSLVVTTVVLAVSRVAASIAYYIYCRDYFRNTASNVIANNPLVIRELFSFGGWVAVSNVVGPMMVYLDRFIIGSILGLVAVTYYVTPYEMVTRLWVVPNAFIDVLFPLLTTALVSNALRAKGLFSAAANALVVLMFPVIALLTLFSSDLLHVWLGEKFVSNSDWILKWLALGVYVNGFARLPFILLHSKGRPDITAKLHLCEMPLFVVVLWLFMQRWGVEGAAVAWTARIVVDTLLLFLLAILNVPEMARQQYSVLTTIVITTIMIAAIWTPGLGDHKSVTAVAVIAMSVCFLAIRIYFTRKKNCGSMCTNEN